MINEYGVRSRADLARQERLHESNVKNIQSSLETEKANVTNKLDLLGNGLKALSNAKQKEAFENKQELKSKNIERNGYER